jgi:hypothetical protein
VLVFRIISVGFNRFIAAAGMRKCERDTVSLFYNRNVISSMELAKLIIQL